MKEILDEIADTIRWLLAGCPKPAKIPITEDRNEVKRKNR